MTRIRSKRILYNDHPFTGDGVSLYATIGAAVQYRNLRIAHGRHIKGAGGEFDLGATSVLKTARVASAAAPATEIEYTFPAAMHSGDVTLNVRRYKDDVENETIAGAQTVTLDGSGNIVTSIDGTATLLSQQQRDGGVVRLRFIYTPAVTGATPVTFNATRTAGPSSPADADVSYVAGQRIYEIDTPALDDSSPYTYTVQAINGATSVDLLTGISVQADATGPPQPTTGSATPW